MKIDKHDIRKGADAQFLDMLPKVRGTEVADVGMVV